VGAGKAELAREYFSRLVEICKDADAEHPELVHARAYVAGAEL
jgi:hypothetical protein